MVQYYSLRGGRQSCNVSHMRRGLVAVGVVSLIVAAGASAAVPAKIVGTWTRPINVPGEANLILQVTKGGDMVFAEDLAAVKTVGANRVQVSGICGTKVGTYAWSVTGATLTFKKVKDRCARTAAILTGGRWTRR